MTNLPVKLGFCPIGKFVFSHEDALRYKTQIENRLRQWGVSYVSLDGAFARWHGARPGACRCGG